MAPIVLLPPPEAMDGETQLQCMKCRKLKGASHFRDSNECIDCAPNAVLSLTQSKTRLGSQRINKDAYSISKHQVNFSATKYIKP